MSLIDWFSLLRMLWNQLVTHLFEAARYRRQPEMLVLGKKNLPQIFSMELVTKIAEDLCSISPDFLWCMAWIYLISTLDWHWAY